MGPYVLIMWPQSKRCSPKKRKGKISDSFPFGIPNSRIWWLDSVGKQASKYFHRPVILLYHFHQLFSLRNIKIASKGCFVFEKENTHTHTQLKRDRRELGLLRWMCFLVYDMVQRTSVSCPVQPKHNVTSVLAQSYVMNTRQALQTEEK